MENSFLTEVVLPLCLFIIMVGMGMTLTVRDFTRVINYPKAVSVGLFGQLILLPAIGLMIAWLLAGEMALAIGLMLLAVCPGGTTSNLITQAAKGDLALSISLTAISSLVTFVTIPVLLGLSFKLFGSREVVPELPVARMMLTLLFLTVVPVGCGMLLLRFTPGIADKLAPLIARFAAVFLAALIVSIMVANRDVLVASLIKAGPATILLNVISMLGGLLIALHMRLPDKQVVSITIETGIQNSALAILLATTVLHNTEYAIAPSIYSLVMYAGSGLFVLLWRRRKTVNHPGYVNQTDSA